MNAEIKWLANDLHVEELREAMLKARKAFRKNNPRASEEQEDNFLKKEFGIKSRKLMYEQIRIILSEL